MSKRKNLAILKHKGEIINAVKNYRVVIIVGQTGCGKSTQVPQYLHESRIDFGLNEGNIIACLHPRSVAAINLAERVAYETKTNVGDLVGYRIRFYPKYNNRTRIMYMTAGYMTRLICTIGGTGNVGIVIIDEAHERSIQNDIIMGQMKKIIKNGSPVKLVIMSATINVDEIKGFYPGAKVIEVTKTADIVEIFYRLPQKENYVATALNIVGEIEKANEKGHILIFLPNENKVRDCKSRIKKSYPHCIVLKFYALMDRDDKLKVFRNYGNCRKIICATNVAETSLTIEGVNFVIDSGLVTRVVYNHEWKLENWIVGRISRAEAEQRKGRTGRTGSGKCFRLFDRFDIEPEKELLTLFNKIHWFANLNKEEKLMMVKRIEKEFTLGELKHTCEGLTDVLEKLTINVTNVDEMIASIKKMFKKEDDPLVNRKDIFMEKVKESLERVTYFKSVKEEDKIHILENIVNKYSIAQLNCISEKDLGHLKKVQIENDLFTKLDIILFEEGIGENLLFKCHFSPFPLPEIKIANLGSLVINLKMMGQADVMSFPFIVVPDQGNVLMAEQHLKDLELIDKNGTLTKLGSEVGNLPLDPLYGKIAVLGSKLRSSAEIFKILAMLYVKNVFKTPSDKNGNIIRNRDSTRTPFDSPHGDLFKLLYVLEEAEATGFSKTWCKENRLIRSNLQYARLVWTQLEERLPPLHYAYILSEKDKILEIKMVLLCGLFDRLAFKIPRKEVEKKNVKKNKNAKENKNDRYVYTLVNEKECQIVEGSCVDKSMEIIMPTILKMSNNRIIVMRNCTSLNRPILRSINPHDYHIPLHLWEQVQVALSKCRQP